jgi:hypothetical protein
MITCLCTYYSCVLLCVFFVHACCAGLILSFIMCMWCHLVFKLVTLQISGNRRQYMSFMCSFSSHVWMTLFYFKYFLFSIFFRLLFCHSYTDMRVLYLICVSNVLSFHYYSWLPVCVLHIYYEIFEPSALCIFVGKSFILYLVYANFLAIFYLQVEFYYVLYCVLFWMLLLYMLP